MFDVASGECELVDFLLTRFDPIDLKTKIRFDPSAQVDEQLAPPKDAEEEAPLVPDKPEPERVAVQIDIKLPPPPGSSVEATDPNDGYRPAAALPQSDGGDVLETAEEEETVEEVVAAEAGPAPGSQDWLALYHQRFQEAAQRYQDEKGPAKNEEDES